MALHRLENTEKQLKRSPDVVHAYTKCIEQYVEKGYVMKDPEHKGIKGPVVFTALPSASKQRDTTKERIVFDASAKI